jgi:NifU-like protein
MPSSLDELKILAKAEQILSRLRPYFQREGTTLSVKDCKDGVVDILVEGACVGCSLSGQDLPGVRDALKEIPGVKDVLLSDSHGLPVL